MNWILRVHVNVFSQSINEQIHKFLVNFHVFSVISTKGNNFHDFLLASPLKRGRGWRGRLGYHVFLFLPGLGCGSGWVGRGDNDVSINSLLFLFQIFHSLWAMHHCGLCHKLINRSPCRLRHLFSFDIIRLKFCDRDFAHTVNLSCSFKELLSGRFGLESDAHVNDRKMLKEK